MRSLAAALLVVVAALAYPAPARACMRMIPLPDRVPPPGAKLEPGAVSVAVARDGERTTLTLANEVQGELRRFAMIIPVPARITEKDVRVLDDDLFRRIDEATGARVIEVRDPPPCAEATMADEGIGMAAEAKAASGAPAASRRELRARDYGVEVQGHFEVGDYDMALLAAKNAQGLGAWLRRFKYEVPAEVEALMAHYLENGTRFLVVRVHLQKLVQGKITRLRPLQIRYRSDALMLPIRMAARAAERPVDFVFYVLASGFASVVSHPTVRLPSLDEVPGFVADDVTAVHAEVMRHAIASQGERAVAVLEYAGYPRGAGGELTERFGAKAGAPSWVTRYRMRVSGHTHDDLELEISERSEPFEVVYRAHRPWQPGAYDDVEGLCPEGKRYLTELSGRVARQVATLRALTGRDEGAIRDRIGRLVVIEPPPTPPRPPSTTTPPAEPPTTPTTEPPATGVAATKVTSWKVVLGLVALVLSLIAFGRWQRSR